MDQGKWIVQSLARDSAVEREVDLGEGVLEIGRATRGLSFPDDAQMADHHARIGVSDDGLTIEDLGTGSGVWLRLQGAEGRRLFNRDQIWLGAQVLVVRESLEGWQLDHHGPDGELRATHEIPSAGVFLGRTSELVLDSEDGQLSRRHAQIAMEGEHPLLFDRGAHNGTYLRLRRPEPLTDGSEFRVATQHFRVVMRSEDSEDSEDSEVTEALAGSKPEPLETNEAQQAKDAGDSGASDGRRRSRGLAARLRQLEGDPVELEDTAVDPADPESDSDLVLMVIESESGSVSLELEPGKTILDAVQEAGLERGEPVDWECGDGGCGVCVLGVIEGASRLDPPDPATGEMKTIQITEQVAPDPTRYRLACMARVRGTVRLRKLT